MTTRLLTPAMAGLLERIHRARRTPFHAQSPEQARADYLAAAEVLEPPRAALPQVRDIRVPAADATPLAARLYRPTAAAMAPVLLYHTAQPSLDHDRSKSRLLAPEGKGYLHALAITDATGHVFKNAQDKFRQINKYVEILSGLIKHIPPDKLKKIIDMGAGKGYLTFALYDYLLGAGFESDVIGVEYRADLVVSL